MSEISPRLSGRLEIEEVGTARAAPGEHLSSGRPRFHERRSAGPTLRSKGGGTGHLEMTPGQAARQHNPGRATACRIASLIH